MVIICRDNVVVVGWLSVVPHYLPIRRGHSFPGSFSARVVLVDYLPTPRPPPPPWWSIVFGLALDGSAFQCPVGFVILYSLSRAVLSLLDFVVFVYVLSSSSVCGFVMFSFCWVHFCFSFCIFAFYVTRFYVFTRLRWVITPVCTRVRISFGMFTYLPPPCAHTSS